MYKIIAIIAFLLLAIPAWATCPATWSNGYSAQVTITIDYTMVSGSSNLTSFPVAATPTGKTWLKTTGNGGYVTDSGGVDILVESETDGVTLPFEVVNYDGSAGTAQIYFLPASVSYTADTLVCLYVGKSGASSEADPSAVWSGTYAAVYHMEQDLSVAGSDLYNSVTETNDATCAAFEAGDTAAGAVGNGVTSNGSGEYCSIDDESFGESHTDGTIEMLAKIPTGSDYWVWAMGDSNGTANDGIRTGPGDVGDQSMFANIGTSWGPAYAYSAISYDAWQHYAFRWDGSATNLDTLVAGVDSANGTAPASGWTNSTNFYLFASATDLDSKRFNPSSMDEIRFAWSFLSDDWLATTSTNLLNADTYVTYGTPVEASGGTTLPKFKVQGIIGAIFWRSAWLLDYWQ